MADGLTEFTPDNITSPDGINQLNRVLRTLYDNIAGDAENVRVYSGYGSPEGVITAGIGSMYMRVDGSTNTSVYMKESGTGNTGWVASTNATFPLSVANGGTGADNSAVVQGVIPYFSATGVISGLATGTSGHYLKTQGAGANPVWAAVTIPTAGLLFVSATTGSGTSTGNISITNTKTYKVIARITGMGGSGGIPIRFNDNSDAVYTSHYAYQKAGTTSDTYITGSTTHVSTGPGAKHDNGIMGVTLEFTIHPQFMDGTNDPIAVNGTSLLSESSGSTFTHSRFAGIWSNTTAATSFKIFHDNTQSFTYTVYLYEYVTS